MGFPYNTIYTHPYINMVSDLRQMIRVDDLLTD